MEVSSPVAPELPGARGAGVSAQPFSRVSARTLPHEWAFGGFLSYTALRLALAGHALSPFTALFLALLAGGVALNVWTGWHPSRLRWTIRLIWYPSIMGVSFYALSAVIPLLAVPSADARLAAADLAILGQPAADTFLAVQTPAFTNLMVVAYLLFFFYLHLGPAHYCIRDVAQFRACFAGMFTIYALGFTGYTLLPAAGPLYAVPFSTSLPGGAFKDAMLAAVNSASNGFDVFPSLHVAVTLYLLLFDFRHFRARFWLLLLPCAALWMSTIYLRYHYFVDVLAGIVVAILGFAISIRYEGSRLAREIDTAEAVAAVAESRATV